MPSRNEPQLRNQWDGMLCEGIKCKRCGQKLRGYEEGFPAERYAGTYNGLCYPCTGAGAFKVETFQYVSGAWSWDHPPHCPSWRRDRERYMAFDDCEKCRGRGCTTVSRADGFGGSYPIQCKDCSERHNAHPLVALIRHLEQIRIVKFSLLRKVANRLWNKRLQAEDCEHDSDRGKEIARELNALIPRSLADGDGPIEWPKGVRPHAGETRAVRRLYGSRLDAEVLDRVLPLPKPKQRRAGVTDRRLSERSTRSLTEETVT